MKVLKKKLLLSLDIVLKIAVLISTAFYIYRVLPAFLYCMYYRFEIPIFYKAFSLADFSYHYEFTSAEYLYNKDFVYTFVSVILTMIIIDIILIFVLKKCIISKTVAIVLYSVIIFISICIASNVGYAAWIYQY